LGGPAGQEIEQQEHQQSTEQTVEQVEGGGAQAHGEKEEFSLGPKDREGPGEGTVHSIDSSRFRHVLLLWNLRDSVPWEKPRKEIHRRDGHADTKEHAGEDALRAAFTEGECEAGYDDGNEREAASDGAGEGRHQNVDSVFPGGRALRERWRREEEC
jgi:hypothetical protein